MTVCGLDQCLEFALFLGQGVKICIRLGVGGVDLVKFCKGVMDFGNGLIDDVFHRFTFVQLRFLGQIPHLDAGLGPGFTDVILVNAGHNAKQGRLTGTIEAEHADLGTREKLREMSLRISRFGGTTLPTRFILYTYCAITGCDLWFRSEQMKYGASEPTPLK